MTDQIIERVVMGIIGVVVIALGIAGMIEDYMRLKEDPPTKFWRYLVVLGIIILGVLAVFIFGGCVEPAKINWAYPTSMTMYDDKNQAIGCIQQGYDSNGFIRWSLALCPDTQKLRQ